MNLHEKARKKSATNVGLSRERDLLRTTSELVLEVEVQQVVYRKMYTGLSDVRHKES
jgi:hypothetical protein